MGLIEPVWIIAVAALWTFYVMAAYESRKGSGKRSNELLWPLLSIAMSVVVIHAINGGAIAVMVGQVLVFIGIGVWRALRD